MMSNRQFALKRTFDITGAFFGLLLLWPVIAVCVIVAQLETGLSGIYSQNRIGQHGKNISVHKIRSMNTVPSKEDTNVTVDQDPRITRSGRLFRTFKLDELPKLWNVLVGDMSFVGPRPDVPGYADKLEGSDRHLLLLRPGITGPASIKYKNEEELLADSVNPIEFNDKVLYPDKVAINLVYLNSWSFFGDVDYILMTIGLKKPHAWLVSE